MLMLTGLSLKGYLFWTFPDPQQSFIDWCYLSKTIPDSTRYSNFSVNSIPKYCHMSPPLPFTTYINTQYISIFCGAHRFLCSRQQQIFHSQWEARGQLLSIYISSILCQWWSVHWKDRIPVICFHTDTQMSIILIWKIEKDETRHYKC